MTGRKPITHTVGVQIYVHLPIFLVKYQPIIPKGAKKTFHDGERMHRLANMTITHGMHVFEKDFEKCKESLAKSGLKNIHGVQMIATLPLYCPKCMQPDGHPNFRLVGKVKSARDEHFKINQEVKYEIYYNHGKPKLHQCHIGYWTPRGYQVAKDIDLQKMSPMYIVKQHGSMSFDLPKEKMKKRKILR